MVSMCVCVCIVYQNKFREVKCYQLSNKQSLVCQIHKTKEKGQPDLTEHCQPNMHEVSKATQPMAI